MVFSKSVFSGCYYFFHYMVGFYAVFGTGFLVLGECETTKDCAAKLHEEVHTLGIQLVQTKQKRADGAKSIEVHKVADVQISNSNSNSNQHSGMFHKKSRLDLKRLDQDKLAAGQSPSASVSDESFGERMTKAFGECLLGFVLLVFSIPVLWFNERRAAQMDSVIAQGEADCQLISAEDAVEESNSGQICHINANARATAPVEDSLFKGATFSDGCLVLSRQVEMYQYLETKKEKTQEQFGGGRRVITEYSYTQSWSMLHQRSENPESSKSNFHYRNPEPSVKLGDGSQVCGQVEYGTSFILGDGLFNQAKNFIPVKDFPDTLSAGGLVFKKEGEYFSTCKSDAPKIGDMRVRFTYIRDGPFTVLALQDEVSKEGRTCFVPYRAIRRSIFGMAKDEEKKALLAEGKKSKEQLMREDLCSNCPSICCCFKIIAQCFTAAFTPEIYHLYDGNLVKSDAFERVHAANSCGTWIGRLGGWFMMFLGLLLIFSPIVTFLNVIPFLGPYLAKGSAFVVGFLSFICTLMLATMISAAAWLFYRPITTLMILAIAYGLCALVATLGAK
jgi:hypothetical protein